MAQVEAALARSSLVVARKIMNEEAAERLTTPRAKVVEAMARRFLYGGLC